MKDFRTEQDGVFFLTYLALNVKKESIKTDADYIGNKNDQLTHKKESIQC